MKKLHIIVLLSIIIAGILFIIFFLISNRTSLAFEKIQVEQLNPAIQSWIHESCQDKQGIHFYEIKKENGYEAVLYFNKYKDVYLYIDQEVDVDYKDGKLTVSISDLPASHESDVKNDFCLYITMRKNPQRVEFFLNNDLMEPENSIKGEIEKVLN